MYEYRVVIGDGASIDSKMNELSAQGFELHSLTATNNGLEGAAGVTVTIVAAMARRLGSPSDPPARQEA